MDQKLNMGIDHTTSMKMSISLRPGTQWSIRSFNKNRERRKIPI